MNPIIRGWMTYFGKYYRTAMFDLLRRINTYLVRWATEIQTVEGVQARETLTERPRPGRAPPGGC